MDSAARLLAGVLVVVAVVGCERAAPPAANPPVARTTPAEPASKPLVRILVQADDPLPGRGEDPAWLTEEARYLLARQGAVRLALPDGPHDPRSSGAVHTLTLRATPTNPGQHMLLTLHAPDGRLLVYQPLGERPGTRLALIQRIAAELGRVAAQNDDAPSLAPLIGTQDAELYDEYTRTHVAYLRAIRTGTIEATRVEPAGRRLERFERMTRRDPTFARAWSALALAYLELRGKDEDALAKLADGAAHRALTLDPQLPEAEAALGRTRYRYGHWLEAEDHLIAALAADPAAPTALEAYACFLLDLGRIAYARQVGAQALGTVPGGDDARECLAVAELAAGHVDDARRTLGPARNDEPAGLARARALADLAAPDYEAARLALADASPRPRQASAWLDPVMAAIADSASDAAAMRALTRAVDVGRIDVVTETLLGAELHQPDFVFNRLIRMRSQHQAVPLRLLWLPGSAYLREHPRFAEVVDQLGLGTYWGQRSRPDHCRTEPDVAGCR